MRVPIISAAERSRIKVTTDKDGTFKTIVFLQILKFSQRNPTRSVRIVLLSCQGIGTKVEENAHSQGSRLFLAEKEV